MLLLRLTLQIVVSLVLFAGLLFVPAGTLDWWRGWVYLGVLTVLGVAGSAWLYVCNRPVLEERLGGLAQRGQPLADKLLVLLGERSTAVTVTFDPTALAPEVLERQVTKIGPAADVYSLGAILYELLKGDEERAGRISRILLRRASKLGPDSEVYARGTALYESLKWVDEQIAATVRDMLTGAEQPADDLEAICLKCLQEEPARRYATAEALADDLRRFQEGKSVSANSSG
jgi:serine/threonine protein kinase